MEAISPQTFCDIKVKVGPKTIRPQEVSALHFSWTYQAEGHFSPPKGVLHQTISALYIRYQNILAFDLFWIFG